ncbi:hypothetical protein J19TS2_33430 [Cohnella xylanilytica]|uniref:Uncharacterized protein n=1 Tax=Cohnella xylanilytica TaxID=557555 RepID=A0A841U351_9BACL|nr:hypothetical protein [Cohnella xylanilytica]MBB6694975.1 hypothetical protein [Cohnella xylanilytica]GIO13788.1 hypothetical protein J19TS2_33430 [Cohnella xylanilytica]
MTTTKENSNTTPSEETNSNHNEQLLELIKNLYQHSIQALKSQFEDSEVEGQVVQHDVYGPLFTFRVKNDQGDWYACGFFLRELLANFQQNKNPALWLGSFFVDLMKVPGGVMLPKPPQSEEEAKALMDGTILPHCFSAVKEEFEPEEVYAGLDLHQEHGPVLEAGFPKYKEGNNVCAMPLHLLLAHYLLNRDPADLLVQGLYRILEEQEKANPQA